MLKPQDFQPLLIIGQDIRFQETEDRYTNDSWLWFKHIQGYGEFAEAMTNDHVLFHQYTLHLF